MSLYRWLAALAIASLALISPIARLLPGGREIFADVRGAVPAAAVIAVGIGPTWVRLLTHGVEEGESAVAVHLTLFVVALVPVLASWLGALAVSGLRGLKA